MSCSTLPPIECRRQALIAPPHVRVTVARMTTTDLTSLPSLELLAAGPRELLLAYRPKSLNNAQWAQVRPQVLDLVARAAPASAAHAKVLASNLCRLVATYAGEVDQLSLNALMTDQNVRRLVMSDERQGMPRATRSARRGALRRLLKVQLDLPAYGTRSPTRPRILNPYSVEDMRSIAGATSTAPRAIRAVVVSALVLAVENGLVLPAAALVDPEQVRPPNPCSPRIQDLLPFLGEDDLERVTPYSKAQWSTVRKWFVTRSLPTLNARRLRDTWVMRRQQEADANGTPVELIVALGGISGALERLAATAAPVRPAEYGRLLRDS